MSGQVCWNWSFKGMILMVNQAPPAASRSRSRLLLQGLLSLVLVVAITYYLRRKIDPAESRAAITAMTWPELTTLGLLAIWNLCTYAFVWMSVTPGLGWARHGHDPGDHRGGQHRAGRVGDRHRHDLQHAGILGLPRSRTTTAVLVSGVLEQLHQAGHAGPALALVALQGRATGGGVVGALLGIAGLVAAIVVFAPMLRSEEQARRFGLLAGPGTIGLVDRWVLITVTSLVSHLSLYVVLLVALRDVGVSDTEVGWAEVLAVFAFARLATAIPLTPGGVGFVEGVLVTGLVGAGGDPDEVAAAVVVYRALTWALPILVGIGCYLWWRRQTWTPPVQDAQLPAKAK